MDQRELFDLSVSWLSLTIAFALLLSGGVFALFTGGARFSLVEAFWISALAVGTGFVFHELAHRQVALHYQMHAKFVMWPFGLVFALVLAAFTPFVFAAPGAVYIYGHEISRRKNGIISVAGPLANIVIGVAFLFATYLVYPDPVLSRLFGAVASINFFLALFNLIPFGPLDGKKVFLWKPSLWAVLFFPLLFFTFF